MSAYQATITNIIDTNAKFQAYVQSIEAAFLASGFLEVAPDTGQINPATVVTPSLNTFAGYRIYRAKDALAATKPLYVKLEFGMTATAGRPKIQRTTGWGSNGAGTLTGISGSMSPTGNSPSGDGSGTYIIWGGGGEASAWVMGYDAGQGSHAFMLNVGRLIDPVDGTPVSPITWDFMSTSSQVMMGNCLWTDGAVSWLNMSAGLASCVPDLSQTFHSGGNTSAIRLYEPVVYRNAKTLTFPAVIGKMAELPFTDADSSQFSLNIWGGSHNFLPLPGNGPMASRLCVPWE
jgi:hypothetical protein